MIDVCSKTLVADPLEDPRAKAGFPTAMVMEAIAAKAASAAVLELTKFQAASDLQGTEISVTVRIQPAGTAKREQQERELASTKSTSTCDLPIPAP